MRGGSVKKTFLGLDVLRFSLACYLILYHTLYDYPNADALPFADLFRFGGCATSTFFILSGFILSHVYVGATGGQHLKVSGAKFLLNRFTNLYPIHIITLLLMVALMPLNSHPYDVVLSGLDSSPEIMHTMSTAEVVINAIMQILLLQAWNPFYLTFNTPSWSLSTLFFFYLCFPALAPRLLRTRRKYALLLVVWVACLLPAIVAIIAGWYGVWAMGTLHTNPLVRLPEFLAGILAYGIFTRHADRIVGFVAPRRRVALLTLAALFAAAAYLFAHGPRSWEILLHNGAMLPAQVALIFVSACVLQDASPRTAAWARRLGNASLSIFALQQPIFTIFLKVQKALEIPYSLLSCVHRVHLCIHAASEAPRQLSYYPVYLILTLFASVVFQEKIIAPIRAPLRRVLTRRQVPGAAPQMVSPSDPQSFESVS
jgi:peptidoglycan/LPS O-acetylase OafA/YrhL